MQFAGILLLIGMLIIGLMVTIATIIGCIVSHIHAKQNGARVQLWKKIVLAVCLILGIAITSFPILFFHMLASNNRKQEEQAAIKEQQALEEVRAYDEKMNTMEAFLEEDPMIGYRLIVTDSTAGSKYYELEKTVDGGTNWTLVNEDPFDGNLGLVEGIVFFTQDNGYIGITNVSGTDSQTYVTYDGGVTFSKVDDQWEW